MPVWTLRLVTCAGLVALLGRLPALDSVLSAFVAGLSVCALGLAALTAVEAAPALATRLRRRLAGPAPLMLRLPFVARLARR